VPEPDEAPLIIGSSSAVVIRKLFASQLAPRRIQAGNSAAQVFGASLGCGGGGGLERVHLNAVRLAFLA
jgi:hypothetical protein